MEILIVGVGGLIGLFLGILLFSLLALAQEADKHSDLLEHSNVTATPVDTYYLAASETMLPARRPQMAPENWQNHGQRMGHI